MRKCELCGEPMPAGEEMFKYHGLSGRCPKPPMPRPTVEAVIEYVHRNAPGGEFWLHIRVNREPWADMMFETAADRQRTHDDLLNMMRSVGAKDLPLMPQ